ncbi:hypothetical protein R3P38DRAFT_2807746 [Favolaschia claudopus]|uniref:Uncharacterized protein n=1 Tax=Favolaschia claudopus TaxID=2862362 RepID=A0AAV9ZHB9_9AGAR
MRLKRSDLYSDITTSQDENSVREDPYTRLERKEEQLLRFALAAPATPAIPARVSRWEPPHSPRGAALHSPPGDPPSSRSTKSLRSRRMRIGGSSDGASESDGDDDDAASAAFTVTPVTVTTSSVSVHSTTAANPSSSSDAMDIDQAHQGPSIVTLKRSHGSQTGPPSKRRRIGLLDSLLRRLSNSGHVLLAHTTYNRDFCISSTDCPIVGSSAQEYDDPENGKNGSHYITVNSGQPFCPVVLGEVKEIVTVDDSSLSSDSVHLHPVYVNIGFPARTWNELDALLWNQLSELDFVIRREAADNDCMLPDADFGSGYRTIKHTIPWSTGPTGDGDVHDRIFLRMSRDSMLIHFQIVRSIPTHTVLAARSPPFHRVPCDSGVVLRNFADVIQVVYLSQEERLRIKNAEAFPSNARTPINAGTSKDVSEEEDEDDFADHVNFPGESGSPIQVLGCSALSVGDFVVALCELVRAEYTVDGAVVRVYLLNVVGLNVVV